MGRGARFRMEIGARSSPQLLGGTEDPGVMSWSPAVPTDGVALPALGSWLFSPRAGFQNLKEKKKRKNYRENPHKPLWSFCCAAEIRKKLIYNPPRSLITSGSRAALCQGWTYFISGFLFYFCVFSLPKFAPRHQPACQGGFRVNPSESLELALLPCPQEL